MLKIKAPIELKCRTGMVPSQDGFVRRITGNYEMLTATVTGEDLLHLVTEPPEVFFAEGSVSTIINQTNIHHNQENKLEILNQLLNRITVDSSLHMTYQDRVYITDMLQKLGVKNVQQFMHQVTQLKEETKNQTELIDHYWNHMAQLQELIQNYKETREEKTEKSEYRQEKNVLHLHQDIMNRLQTGSIYQILANFTHNQSSRAEYISGDELRSAEYYRITRNILLNTLENEARGENLPLEYRYENYYEEVLPDTEEITEQKITNRIASAVLLQLADNLYQNRHESVERKGDTWYTVSNALYRSAENTMNRLHRNFVQQYYRSDRAGDYLVHLNENYRQELALLDRMVSLRETVDVRERSTSAPGAVTLENVQQYREEETYQNLTDNRSYREGDRYSQNRAGDTTEEKNYRQDILSQEMYLNREQNTFEDTDIQIHREQQDVTLEQLEEFHRHNVENRNKYYQTLERLKNLQERPGKTPDLQRMRKEGLLALEHPQELLEQLKEEGREQQEQAAQRRQQALELLPQETQRIYEVLEQYLQTPERYRQAETATNRDIGRLQRDIELVQRESHERIQTDVHTDTRRESRSETLEQRWRNQPPAELQYPEEVPDETGETAPEGSSVQPAGTRDLVERQIREREQWNTYTERQENSRSETLEQNWRALPPAELQYPEEVPGSAGETIPEGIPLEQAGTRELVERQIREQELRNTYTDRQKESRSETLEQRWRNLPPTELYYGEGETGGGRGTTPQSGAADPVRDREIVERRLLEQERRDAYADRQFRDISRTVVERWEENYRREPVQSAVTREEHRNQIALVHKQQTENEITEEIMEQLVNQNRVLENQTKVMEEVTQSSKTVERRVTNQTTHEITEQTENLTEMINRGVQGRIGDITDQVYSRLEKRLQNERRRRGI